MACPSEWDLRDAWETVLIISFSFRWLLSITSLRFNLITKWTKRPFCPPYLPPSDLMLRILTRTAATPSRVVRVAPTTRCGYVPFSGFLRSTATVAAETSKPSAVDELAIISSKDMPQLDSELVDPVLRWLLDEQNILEAPHIPVKGVH